MASATSRRIIDALAVNTLKLEISRSGESRTSGARVSAP
jgi:hypothetical protein